LNPYEQERVNPGHNSVSSDLYTVLKYYPEWETCDLISASPNARGALQQVPIAVGHGGSWENQQRHEPAVENKADPGKWGNCDRGPRWGESFPVQEGDLAEVRFVGANQSVPLITKFLHWRGNYGPAFVAKNLKSRPDGLPSSDKEIDNRYDLLLPSGAWLRSTGDGGWIIATPPVDNPKAFIALHADGTIHISGSHVIITAPGGIEQNP
jgi:hypothetical protein